MILGVKMSSGHIIILCRNMRTGELKISPNMTLYDMGGAKQCLETTKRIVTLRQDADDWAISIYKEHWEPVEGWEAGDIL